MGDTGDVAHALTQLFARVVYAVGGTGSGLEAVRQVERLRDGEGTVVLAAIAETLEAARAGIQAAIWRKEIRAGAQEAVDSARELAPGADVRIADGRAASGLRWIVEDEEATLVACEIGHGRRAMGMLLGSVATAMLRDAPCSVLVARAPADAGAFPASITVGVDGSPESRRAAEIAAELGRRLGATVRAVVATGGKPVATAGIDVDGLEVETGSPVDALVTASQGSDLLVVGSRGLHGIRRLGSVSEQVAHRASCSVLVVRPPVVGEISDGLHVRDVMSMPAITAGLDVTVGEVARLMIDRGVGSVVVVGADGAIAGIVTETDFEVSDQPVADTRFRWPRFLGKLVWSEQSLEEVYAEAAALRVESIMTSPVETVDAGAELWDAVRTLTEKGHKRLPVLDGGQLVGVVSQSDLVKFLLASRSE